MIGIVDYGLGNVRAFENIYRRLGIDARPVKTSMELVEADRLILPGVGAFDWAMSSLQQSGMLEGLNQRVLDERVPVLGVCVGMQMMADGSAEGVAKGLGWISGQVRRLDEAALNQRTHLPHMGWNDVQPKPNVPLFSGLEAPEFYFLHSYFFDVQGDEDSIATSCYGQVFACSIRRGNIWATQFHPEKSHDCGIRLLKNFAELC